MKLVRFKGPMGLPSQSARHLDAGTLERLGVSVPDSLLTNGILVFGPKTGHTVEMSNEASDSLVAALPSEFEIVDEDEVDAPITPLTNLTPPQGDAEKDADDETDADDESPDDD